MYADQVTDSMERAISETERRRGIQKRYNKDHGITPTSIVKDIRDVLEITSKDVRNEKGKKLSKAEREELIKRMTKEMRHAAQLLEFEYAAELRDRIHQLQKKR
jgi:excinuclease ABC subunit B